MSVIKITSVGQGKSKTDDKGKEISAGKKYAKNIRGEVFFPQQGIDFKAGDYAYVVTQPAQVMNEEGVWTPDPTGRTISLITAVFSSKAEAIEAMNEEEVLVLEAKSALHKVAKECGLDMNKVNQLETLAAL